MITLFPHQQTALTETESFNLVGYYLDMGLEKTYVGSEKTNYLERLKAMNEEKKNLPVEGEDIPAEWQEAISARRNRRAAETIVAEPVKDACMDYARAGWRMAYIMTAVAGAAVGLCAWLVGVAL